MARIRLPLPSSFWNAFICGLLLVLACSLSAFPAHAQKTLQLFTPVTSKIESGAFESWSFSAPSGAVLSFAVEATSGGLDPAIQITSSSGTPLIANDDYDYPTSKDSLLEAITIPRTDTYTLTVSGVNKTSGDYKLTMTSGYSQVADSDTFDGDVQWKALSQPLSASKNSGQLALTLSGVNQLGIATNPNSKTLADYYAQVAVTVGGTGGWLVGMTARQTDTDHYYLLQINDGGMWRFLLHQPSGDQVIHDWVPHPAIVAGSGNFTLGMLVSGTGYDFFYNGQFFGRLSEATLTKSGQIGLSIGTRSALNSQTNAQFDNLEVTAPLEVRGSRVIPQQLIGGSAGDTTQELQRRGLIPSGGKMGLNVDSSFVQSRHPGIERVMLARGTTYQNFVFGSTISWAAVSSGVTGCGLIFRSVDDSHYTLSYLDQSGSYGVSQRDGDSFKPGIFGSLPSLKTGSHQVLIIAQDNQLLYYVDDQYEGKLDDPSVDGAVGNAVVNFDPISTSCQFNNTWVWDLSGTGS